MVIFGLTIPFNSLQYTVKTRHFNLKISLSGFPQTEKIREQLKYNYRPGKSAKLKKIGKFREFDKGEIIQGKIREFYFGTPCYFCKFLHFTCSNYLNN